MYEKVTLCFPSSAVFPSGSGSKCVVVVVVARSGEIASADCCVDVREAAVIVLK